MKNGHVIFLNGTSSSGKTTIAKALQEKLPEPYMYVSIDNFFHMYPDRFLNPTNRKEALMLERLVPAVLSGLHRSVAALAHAGNNILVDHLLQEDGLLQECVENWAELDVLFVGVKCPLVMTEKLLFGFAGWLVRADGVIPMRQNTMWFEIEKCLLFTGNMVACFILFSIQISTTA